MAPPHWPSPAVSKDNALATLKTGRTWLASNSAISLAAPGADFLTKWEQFMATQRFTLTSALEVCCGFATTHGHLVKSPLSIRVAPGSLARHKSASHWNDTRMAKAPMASRQEPMGLMGEYRDWRKQLEYIVSRPGTEALHFAGGSLSNSRAANRAKSSYLLENAIAQAGARGGDALRRRARCVEAVRRSVETVSLLDNDVEV